MWAQGGTEGGIPPPLKVKPSVVKYEFQNYLIYCVPPPEAQNWTFACPRMPGVVEPGELLVHDRHESLSQLIPHPLKPLHVPVYHGVPDHQIQVQNFQSKVSTVSV